MFRTSISKSDDFFYKKDAYRDMASFVKCCQQKPSFKKWEGKRFSLVKAALNAIEALNENQINIGHDNLWNIYQDPSFPSEFKAELVQCALNDLIGYQPESNSEGVNSYSSTTEKNICTNCFLWLAQWEATPEGKTYRRVLEKMAACKQSQAKYQMKWWGAIALTSYGMFNPKLNLPKEIKEEILSYIPPYFEETTRETANNAFFIKKAKDFCEKYSEKLKPIDTKLRK